MIGFEETPDGRNWNTYRIVAEYRGVAILVKDGDRGLIRNGEEHFTDGYFYILCKCPHIGIPGRLRPTTELMAKEYVDQLLDHPETLDEEWLASCMSYAEVYELLSGMPFTGNAPTFSWDQTVKHFTLNEKQDETAA